MSGPRPRNPHLVVAIVAGAIGIAPAVSADPTTAPFLDRLEEVLASNPDDPDLFFQHALELGDEGRAGEAVDRLRVFEERWPGRRGDSRAELARLLLEDGQAGEALAVSEDWIRREPTAGLAHLYRGLALRAAGRSEEALAAFDEAARLTPEIEPEVLLVRAIDLLDAGEETEAEALLRRVIEIDPTGEAARRARLLLPPRPTLKARRWWRADGYAGLQWDSNVTLDAGSEAVRGLERDQRDWSGVFGAGLTLHAPGGERVGLSGGYRYDRAEYFEISSYDYAVHSAFVSPRVRVTESLLLRLDTVATFSWLDGDRYATTAGARPNLFYEWGNGFGASRIFGDFEWRGYEDNPVLSPVERDEINTGAGLEHYLPLGDPARWASIGGRYEYHDARGESLSDFEGDYDYHVFSGQVGLHLPLVWEVVLDVDFEIAHERYAHTNLVAFLEDGALKERRDLFGELDVLVSAPISPFITLELSWRGIIRDSNVGRFDYERQVFGVSLRVTSE